jgi:hypothetical protein
MSTTNQSDVKPRTGFAENEPVVVAHIVLWVLANIGAFIVGHTHLFTSDQWSSFSTGLVPIITAAILSFSAMVARKYVTPFWKRVTDFENRHHLPVLTADRRHRRTTRPGFCRQTEVQRSFRITKQYSHCHRQRWWWRNISESGHFLILPI